MRQLSKISTKILFMSRFSDMLLSIKLKSNRAAKYTPVYVLSEAIKFLNFTQRICSMRCKVT